MDDDFDFNEMLEEYGIDANEFNAPSDAGPGLAFGARAPYYDPAMVRQHYEHALGVQEYAGQLEFFLSLLLLVLGTVLMRVAVEQLRTTPRFPSPSSSNRLRSTTRTIMNTTTRSSSTCPLTRTPSDLRVPHPVIRVALSSPMLNPHSQRIAVQYLSLSIHSPSRKTDLKDVCRDAYLYI